MTDWVVAGGVTVVIFILLSVVAAGILAAKFELNSDVECLVSCLIAVTCWLFLLFPLAEQIGMDATGHVVEKVDPRWTHTVEAVTLFLPMGLAPLISRLSRQPGKQER